MIDHDRLFKELLGTFFAEFLELFVPDLTAYLDIRSIEFVDKEVFTDITLGTTHLADLVAKAKCRDQESFFLIHLEHQAQSQTEFSRRMFSYFAALFGRHNLPVYPIALFSHGSLKPESNEFRIAFPNKEVLRFEYDVVQLSRLKWQDFVGRPNPVASALMARMGMAPEDRPQAKLECLRSLVTLGLNPARERLISGFIDSYLRLDERETLLFEQQRVKIPNETEKAKVMELTTSWKEEGRAEERREAHERECQLILRPLRKRFGKFDPEWEDGVRKLSSDQLQALAEASVDFRSIAELKNWLVPR